MSLCFYTNHRYSVVIVKRKGLSTGAWAAPSHARNAWPWVRGLRQLATMSGSAAPRVPGRIRAEYVVRPEEVSFSNGLFKAMDIFAQRDEINRRVAQLE